MPKGWAKGQSGNPGGRPPNSRALAQLLGRASLKRYASVQPDGTTKLIQARKLFADRVWEGLATGKIVFDDKTNIELIGRDYIALAQMVINHLDGPAPTDLDITTATNGVQIVIRPATPEDYIAAHDPDQD